MAIMMVLSLTGIPASANASPRVSPSAHLWHMTAAERASTSPVPFESPIESPSNMACIPTATYRMKGVRLMRSFLGMSMGAWSLISPPRFDREALDMIWLWRLF